MTAVLDPEIRRHIALHFCWGGGGGASYQQARVKVLELVSIICGSGTSSGGGQHKGCSDPMQVGSFKGNWGAADAAEGAWGTAGTVD